MIMRCSFILALIFIHNSEADWWPSGGEEIPDGPPSISRGPTTEDIDSGGIVNLECAVQNYHNEPVSVEWRYLDHNVLLYKDHEKHVQDPRWRSLKGFMMDSRAEHFGIQLRNISLYDAGTYECRLSNGEAASADIMVDGKLHAPVNTTAASQTDKSGCCLAEKVPYTCLQPCIRRLDQSELNLYAATCSQYFDAYIKCGTDGRNHVPCCVRKELPYNCLQACSSESTFMWQDFTCVAQLDSIMDCYSEGAETIPVCPVNFTATATSPHTIQFRWAAPEVPTTYTAAAIKYRVFFAVALGSPPGWPALTFNSTRLLATLETSADTFAPNTKYVTYATAVSPSGASAPSPMMTVRTYREGLDPNVTEAQAMLKCCTADQSIPATCATQLCRPHGPTNTKETQRMECATALTGAVSCLAGKHNHTRCCVNRLVPAVCLPFCSGSPPATNVTHLTCLPYLPSMSACFSAGLLSLPHPPEKFLVRDVTHNSALFLWNPPKSGIDRVLRYKIVLESRPTRTLPHITESDPVIVSLDKTKTTSNSWSARGLLPDRPYSAYMVTENDDGSSAPSNQVFFLTYQSPADVAPPPTPDGTYIPPTAQECCNRTVKAPMCRAFLCNRDTTELANVLASQQTWVIISENCPTEFSAFSTCYADARNNTACCYRKQVPLQCQETCSPHPLFRYDTVPLSCIRETNKIVQCQAQGRELHPLPPTAFMVQNFTEHLIALRWKPPRQGPAPINYVLHYDEWNIVPIPSSRFSEQPGREIAPTRFTVEISASENRYIMQNLKNGTRYKIWLVSKGPYGHSMPSNEVILRTPSPTPNLPPLPRRKDLEFYTNMTQCCAAANVSPSCRGDCEDLTRLSTSLNKCTSEAPEYFHCWAGQRDTTECCVNARVPALCRPLCNGQRIEWQPACLSVVDRIASCFREGHDILPTPPVNLTVQWDDIDGARISWGKADSNSDAAVYIVYYRYMTGSNKIWSVNTTNFSITLDHLLPASHYETYIVTSNMYGRSLSSPKVTFWTSGSDDKLDILMQPGQIAIHGRNATLFCVGEQGDPAKFTYAWLKDGELLPTTASSLVLANITPEDSAMYTCVLTSRGVSRNVTRLFRVMSTPRTETTPIVVGMQKQKAAEDDFTYFLDTSVLRRVVMHCRFSGNPINIYWMHNGTAIDSGVTVRYINATITESFVVLYSIDSAAGDYMCRATNLLGSDSAHIKVSLFPVGQPAPTTSAPFVTDKPPPTTDEVHKCCLSKSVSSPCMGLCTAKTPDNTLALRCPAELWNVFMCHSGQRDERPCCADNGVPEECRLFCAAGLVEMGNQPRHFDSRFFLCMRYAVPVFTCLTSSNWQPRRPSAPTKMEVIELDYGLRIIWEPPVVKSEYVTHYNVSFIQPDGLDPRSPGNVTVKSKTFSYDLLALIPGAEYIVMVQSIYPGGTTMTKPVHKVVRPSRPSRLNATFISLTASSGSVFWSIQPEVSREEPMKATVYVKTSHDPTHWQKLTDVVPPLQIDSLTATENRTYIIITANEASPPIIAHYTPFMTLHFVSSIQEDPLHKRLAIGFGVTLLLVLLAVAVAAVFLYRRFRTSYNAFHDSTSVHFENQAPGLAYTVSEEGGLAASSVTVEENPYNTLGGSSSSDGDSPKKPPLD